MKNDFFFLNAPEDPVNQKLDQLDSHKILQKSDPNRTVPCWS